MEALLVHYTALGYIIPILFGWAGYNKARQKHRTPLLWGIICLLTSLIGYVVLCCSSSLEYDEELDYTTESDTLGYVMLILGLFWTAFMFWIYSGNGVKVLGY